MKTNEVEKLLGISKHTILYYEKEGFIHPKRDDNGYRCFVEKDIELLELIIKLRNMEMSIDEIHSVLDGKASIRDIIETKEEYFNLKEKELSDKKKAIQDYIKREKVNISFHGEILDRSQYETLYFNKDDIRLLDFSIPVKDIQKIKLSMCSQIALLHLIRTFLNYYIDVDIVTSFDTYSYQMMNEKQGQMLFEYLHDQSLKYEDPLELEKIYKTIPDPVQRNKYINSHFQKWAKKYHLDNPRGKYIYTKQSELTNDKVNDHSLYHEINKNVKEITSSKNASQNVLELMKDDLKKILKIKHK